jgi:hypothetical protein
MSVGAFAVDTQTAVISTEHFLADVNEAGVYTLHVDMSNMAAGDVVELRIYQMVLTGGTPREQSCSRFYGAQTREPIKKSIPISNELTDSQALRFSLTQTFGTGRDFPWKVLKHS